MTHSNITTYNNLLDQQQTIPTNTPESSIGSLQEKSNYGERVYLAVKNKIKNHQLTVGSEEYDEDLRIIRLFIDNRNFLNAKNNENGNNALHVAVLENDLMTVKNLTALGINREDKNFENKEPLDLANLLGRDEISKYLRDLKKSDRSLDEVYLQQYRHQTSNVTTSIAHPHSSSLSSARSTGLES
jgi:ankyrin repeat protein